MAVFTAIAALVAGALATTSIGGIAVAGVALSSIIGYTVATAVTVGLMFGGMALSKAAMGSKGADGSYSSPLSSSPTYGSGVIQTQTNNNLPIALIYGNVKCAGNRLWQNDSGESTIKRLVSFGWGQIGGYTAIKLNDNNYDDSGINATVAQYLGTSSQVISTLIPGATNAERAEVVGGLKNIAYLAIEVGKSDKVDINYNLTALVQGLKVKQYTDEDTFTTAFSNNTAWCLLDLLTNYNGLRLGRDANNAFDNDILKEIVDIQSFIDAADYCDDEIGYYAKTTALTGDNNDLIWQGRASGDNGITITYTNPGTGHATASIAVDVDNNIVVTLANPSGTITTTANDIIDLVNNDSDVSALVRVMSADDNDGTGVVTAMTQQALTLDEAVTRYTFNMIFDSKFSIRDAVEEFKLNCNGAFCVKDGKLQFKIDKPETSSQTFTTKDIKRGSLKEWFEPRGDRYDVLKVEYIDPEYDYSKVEAHIERTTPFNTPTIDHKIQCYSVNNFFHASRLGKLYMLRSELCPRFISFTTGMQAVGRQIGDVITLTYVKGGTTIFNAKKFKIYMIVDNQKGELEIYCREYDARIYSDELGSLEPVVNQITIDPQAKLRSATFVIASPDSLNKEQADFICDNTGGAEVIINQAINQLPLQVVEIGTAGVGTTKNSIILGNALETADDAYNGLYIRFTSGACAGEAPKLIQDYVGSTKAATVEYRTEIACFQVFPDAAPSTTITLKGDLVSTEDDYYNGCKIVFPSLGGIERTITDYDGTTKTVTLSTAASGTYRDFRTCYIYRKDEFSNTPASGDAYEILSYSGSVLLLEGTYRVKSAILSGSGVLIEGLGDGTIIEINYNDSEIIGHTVTNVYSYPEYNEENNIPLISCFAPKEYLIGGKNLKYSDLTVAYVYNYINGLSGHENSFYGKSSSLSIQNVMFKMRLDAWGAKNAIITNCRFYTDAYNNKNLIGDNSIVNNCYFNKCSLQCYGNNMTVSNNQFNKYTYSALNVGGVLAATCNNCNICNNTFYNCGDASSSYLNACMWFNQTTNSIIAGNVAAGCYYGLIGSGNTFIDNTITGNSSVSNSIAGRGSSDFYFSADGVNYNNFQNNTVRANPSGGKSNFAIFLYGNYNVISNNDLKGTTSYAIATTSITGTGNIKNYNRT